MKRVTSLLAICALGAFAVAQYYPKTQPEAQIPEEIRIATRSDGIGVRIDQRLNEFVPLDAKFQDEYGRTVELGSYFRDKPVLLLPIFYRCPGICEKELYNLVDSVKGFKKDFVGREFNIVVFSIDPREKPELAAQKKDTVIGSYMGASTDRVKRVQAESGWHFLTGDRTTIDRLCDAVGFKYTFDTRNGSIVHPAGIMVLTPAGKISRYLVTDEYPQRVLLDSIKDADQELVGVKDDRPFFMACVQIDPLTGQKSMNVLNTIKTLGVLTVISILVSILFWNRKHKTSHRGTE